MAKITRSVLKSLVKECLVEILIEGIDGDPADVLEESLDYENKNIKQQNYNKKMGDIQKQRDLLDSRKVDTRRQQFEEQTAANINTLTEDPTMQAIFADTAATTLQEQVETKGKMAYRGGGDAASLAVANNELSDLFDGSNNWADLAFSSQKPRT